MDVEKVGLALGIIASVIAIIQFLKPKKPEENKETVHHYTKEVFVKDEASSKHPILNAFIFILVAPFKLLLHKNEKKTGIASLFQSDVNSHQLLGGLLLCVYALPLVFIYFWISDLNQTFGDPLCYGQKRASSNNLDLIENYPSQSSNTPQTIGCSVSIIDHAYGYSTISLAAFQANENFYPFRFRKGRAIIEYELQFTNGEVQRSTESVCYVNNDNLISFHETIRTPAVGKLDTNNYGELVGIVPKVKCSIQ